MTFTHDIQYYDEERDENMLCCYGYCCCCYCLLGAARRRCGNATNMKYFPISGVRCCYCYVLNRKCIVGITYRIRIINIYNIYIKSTD